MNQLISQKLKKKYKRKKNLKKKKVKKKKLRNKNKKRSHFGRVKKKIKKVLRKNNRKLLYKIKEEMVFEQSHIIVDNYQNGEILEIKEDCDPLDDIDNKIQNEESTIEGNDHSMPNHMKIWHQGNSNKHKCEQCGNGFSTKTLLKQHIRLVHSSKFHDCKECDKKFKHIQDLTRHISSAHRGNQHLCNDCV
jgi:uncharacterized Zn-finger protein